MPAQSARRAAPPHAARPTLTSTPAARQRHPVVQRGEDLLPVGTGPLPPTPGTLGVDAQHGPAHDAADLRIPITGNNPAAKRLEFRVPDPSANPYLAFSAMMMAGVDGIRNKIEPPQPIDKDLYELPPEEARGVPKVPGSLSEVLDNLESDHDYLLEGGVFTPDLIETWIDYKRTQEVDEIRLRPHPHEFALYYDV